jgi:site-specific DNA-methyltransferase (adenine-specific)
MLATMAPMMSRIYLGNCLDVLETLADESVDCIITDPPYGINYLSRSHSLPLTKIANDGEEAYELLDKALAIARYKLKPDRHLYIFTNWQAFESMAPIVRKYFTLKGALAWIKNNRTRGDLKGNYGYQYEMVLYAHKGRRYLFGKRDSDVLHFDKVPTQLMQHPTEKPVKLLEYLIAKSTAEGETVLDMFMGSGSTCVAAKRLHREYIGIELEKEWFEVATKRLETSTR